MQWDILHDTCLPILGWWRRVICTQWGSLVDTFLGGCTSYIAISAIYEVWGTLRVTHFFMNHGEIVGGALAFTHGHLSHGNP